jgi:hypothetical protein
VTHACGHRLVGVGLAQLLAQRGRLAEVVGGAPAAGRNTMS